MKGKLDLKGKEYKDMEIIMNERFFKHMKELDLKEELPEELIKFAESNFNSGFIDCITWLEENRILKIKTQ